MKDPSACVVTVTMLELHANTNTICAPPKPTPFAVSMPETVNCAPPCTVLGVAITVKDVEMGFESDAVFRFSVIVPGPANVTTVGLFEPEHVKPPEQLQLESV